MEYKAFIARENWAPDRVLVKIGRFTSERTEFFMQDGTWVVVPDREVEPDSGLILPAGAIEALAVAIQEFQGHASHADTEARVLREWLATERFRVDSFLKAAGAGDE